MTGVRKPSLIIGWMPGYYSKESRLMENVDEWYFVLPGQEETQTLPSLPN